MLYAQVVLGLPVEGPFDYIVPLNLTKKIAIGQRVWVNFSQRKLVGYVVGLSQKTKIKKLKPILKIIDTEPVLDKNILSLTKELSNYYCCSWGEAIETALPESLRRGRILAEVKTEQFTTQKNKAQITLVHALDIKARWQIYFNQIKDTLEMGKKVLILLPDKTYLLKVKELISLKFDATLATLYRNQPQEIKEWLKIKEAKANIVIGTRSGIFAPLNNLGLIIIDEEQDSLYKQDQVPHYHSREVAFMRAQKEGIRLILGSSSPSLESFYLAKKNKIHYIFIPPKEPYPEVKILDTKYHPKKIIFSKYLEEAISQTLSQKGKILLFLNRKGFATFIFCPQCSIILKCQRCQVNLVYYFKENLLICPYCNFKMSAPKICPYCNSGYIRYTGLGTEKIESELARIFPQVKIKRVESEQIPKIEEADIFVSTESIVRRINFLNEDKNFNNIFDLVGVLSIDNLLNRFDFRAAEKTFALLIGLIKLTKKKIVIQTQLPQHYCFSALENKNLNLFYEEELKQRKELKLPPYKHIALVKIRGKSALRVEKIANLLLKNLKKINKDKNIKILSATPAIPSKLRGKFYWQVLLKATLAEKLTQFLKINLKKFSRSGIIITVDIDPL